MEDISENDKKRTHFANDDNNLCFEPHVHDINSSDFDVKTSLPIGETMDIDDLSSFHGRGYDALKETHCETGRVGKSNPNNIINFYLFQ